MRNPLLVSAAIVAVLQFALAVPMRRSANVAHGEWLDNYAYAILESDPRYY